MEYDLNKNISDYPSSLQMEQSIEKLLEHSKNKNKFRINPFLASTGGRDCSDYTNKSIKRSKFAQKIFYGTTFKNSAAAGANFVHCTFDNCKFINANFQECTFLECNIKNNSINNPVTNSNFNRSLFSNSFHIKNTYFQHSIFRQTAFLDGILQNTTFYSSTLEDTLFFNVFMDSVRFNDLNIDYSVFTNVHMNDVILPFSQICFTFGLLPYLMKTDDNVYITSAQNDNGYISKEEFLALLTYFEIYYRGTNDFFPLANIYLSLEQYDKAKEAVLNGILLATTNYDFRQIKYLSKLIHMYSVFDFHQRKQIYDYINAHITFYDMNPNLSYNYNTYKNEISSFLLNNNRSGIATSEIDIVTNVYPNEPDKLGILLATLEEIIEHGKSNNGEHEILCRHNSAEEIVITIQDMYQALQVIIPMVYSVLLGALVLEEKWNKRLINKFEQKNAAEQKEIEMQTARIKLEREKIALEKEKAEFEKWKLEELNKDNRIKHDILRRNIVNNDIDISAISHITYGNIPPEADKRICQFSYTKNT